MSPNKISQKIPENVTDLDNPRELIDLLKYINQQCMQGETYKSHVVLLPVELGDLYYIGRDSHLLYYSLLGNQNILSGMYFREFLAKFWGKKPRVKDLTSIWVFDPLGSGSFPTRLRILEDSTLIKAVNSAINSFAQDLEKNREERKKNAREAGSYVPRWEFCSICDSIPEKNYGFWKGGELQSGGLPPNEKLLEVLGAPFFDDISSRGWCIKRCPECGTYYKWESDYEYLVNGTEDEINLVRLSVVEAKEWVQKVYDTIRASAEDFKKRAPPHLAVLMAATNQKSLKSAADFISYAQNVQGHDITFTIPALVYALAHHPHTQSGLDCPGYWISSILSKHAEKQRENASNLLNLMQQQSPTSVGDEFEQLLARTKKRVAEKANF